jgi:glycine hydroxymethyltransferase
LIDVRPFGLTGRQAESALREVGITLNRNSLPFDPNGPWYTSGLRIGTPAVTTLGMQAAQMKEIAAVTKQVLSAMTPADVTSGPKAGTKSPAKYELSPRVVEEARARVAVLLEAFPVYPNLDLALLDRHFG